MFFRTTDSIVLWSICLNPIPYGAYKSITPDRPKKFVELVRQQVSSQTFPINRSFAIDFLTFYSLRLAFLALASTALIYASSTFLWNLTVITACLAFVKIRTSSVREMCSSLPKMFPLFISYSRMSRLILIFSLLFLGVYIITVSSVGVPASLTT